jgi:hypothetical protein
MLEVDVRLFQNDLDNIHFICKFHERLNSILEKYSNITFRFPAYTFDNLQKNSIHLSLQVNYTTREIEVQRNTHEEIELKLLYDYIEYFELIQKCMFIYNFYDKTPEERARYELKNTFALIGSYRQFAHLSNSVSLEADATNREQTMLMESTKNQSVLPIGFEYLKRKIANQMRDDGHSVILDEINGICGEYL